ncbi:MAG: uracil-DNA glycosylase [Anaeroplasmataceae bacterium]
MWKDFIDCEKEKQYFKELMAFVDNEYKNYKCHPAYDDIFNAFKYTELNDVKAVILGQDPYINDGEAHGLCFSVEDSHLTPTLKNIYKEMSSDLNVEVSQDGNLEYLAHQGVFMLNTILTVRDKESMSHKKKGWEIFTDNAIKRLNEENHPIVFILWGAPSIKKASMITNPIHLVITSPHPSPLGAYRGFFGSKPFSKTNEFLIKNNIEPIKWYKSLKSPTLFDIL